MTQRERLRAYLKKHRSITPMQALSSLGIMALSQRIGELRREGMQIGTRSHKVQGRFGKHVVARYVY